MNEIKDKGHKKKLFLDFLGQGWTVTKAAATADVAQVTLYRWRQADSRFAQEWEAAIETGTDRLEDEAFRRAVEGVEETAYYNGQPVGVIRRYSDNLLTLLLRARRPAKFYTRSAVEHSVVPMPETKRRELTEEIMKMMETIARRHVGEDQWRVVPIRVIGAQIGEAEGTEVDLRTIADNSDVTRGKN